MASFVAFLRGMNVGGHRVTSAELRAVFAGMGFDGAATFRTSGNVIFDERGGGPRDEIRERIEQGLETALGYAVPTFLRDASETRAIAAHEPFDPDLVAASKGKLQVVLLEQAPDPQTRDEVLAHATEDDRLALHGRELYWLPNGGTIDSQLDLEAIATLVGLTTMRTKGTIDLIAAKHCGG